ncbi:MAG: hypothetical protein HY718_17330, partial [Planctomycetes bacterium]|nr:hypothetical protein [Planctomycetota bacterium]
MVTIRVEATPPPAASLGWLDAADRFLVEKLFQDPAEYVDHPVFHEPRAEQKLFGRRSVLPAGSTYFAEPERCGLHDGGRGGPLDANSERRLFQRFNYARMRVARLLQRYRGCCVPQPALRLVLAWLHRALILRGQLAQANIALVAAMAKRSRFGGLDPNEVISAGNYALLRSIDRFDCSRGFKFS